MIKRSLHNKLKKFLWNFNCNMRIRFKLLLLVVPVLVISTLVTMSIVFANVKKNVYEETLTLMKTNVNQITEAINYSISHHELALKTFFSSGRLNTLLNHPSGVEESEYIDLLKQEVLNFKIMNENVSDLRIFAYRPYVDPDSTTLFNISVLFNHPSYVRLSSLGNDSFFWTDASDSSWNKFSYFDTIYGYYTVFDENGVNPVAIIRIDITVESIFSQFEKTDATDTELCIINEYGGVVFTNSPEGRNRSEYNEYKNRIAEQGLDNGYFIYTGDSSSEYVCYQINHLGWYTIHIIPTDQLLENINQMRLFTYTIAAAMLLIAAILLNVLLHLITKRLLHLSTEINRFPADGIQIRLREEGHDEVGMVTRSVNAMLENIQRLMSENDLQKEREHLLMQEKHQQEMLRIEAEFRVLQMQINPHFLYNTLETIKGLVYSDDPQTNIIRSTQALSDLFRYNLNTTYIVCIRDEIRHLSDYLVIQNLRLDACTHLICNLSEDVLDTPVLRFTFEPIVENCMKHGFRTGAKHNYIEICSCYAERQLHISIADNGIGMTPERLEQVRNMLEEKTEEAVSTQSKSGIGIRNVHLRIQKYFGEEYGLSIDSKHKKGTTVTIKLPQTYKT